MANLTSALLHAARRLLKTPGFTALCIITLSAGIGAGTVVFSVVNGILLRPLPYPQSERLVGLWHTAPGLDLERMPQSLGTYFLYGGESPKLEAVALYRELRLNLAGGDLPERIPAAAVTGSFFQVLQVPPQLGRAFGPEEERPGAEPVIVLSNGLWRRRFGADPEILGKTLLADGESVRVIAVMPAQFAFPDESTDAWLPLEIDPSRPRLGQFDYVGLGRLAPGVDRTTAEADLNRLVNELETRFPESDAAPVLRNAGFAARVHPLRDDVVGDVGSVLWNLLGAVGFVLLIACANVANLLVVRGEGRRRETAIQAALGASRGRLIGAVLAESVLLALAAGLVGIVLAWIGLDVLRILEPGNLPRLEQVAIDGRVLAFTAVLSLTASLLFGVLPSLRLTATETLSAEIKAGGGARGATLDRGRRRLRQVLVGVQIALALVLLAGSGLVLRSFLNLSRTDPGFETSDLVALDLALPERAFGDDAATARFFQDILHRIETLPGVVSAGATSTLPLSGSDQAKGHVVEGFSIEPGTPPPLIQFEYVTPGYFETMGIPLRAGRTLLASDVEERSGAVVVNEILARRYWPDGGALGKRLRPAGQAREDLWYTVVGVVGAIRSRRLTDEPREVVYYPLVGRTTADWVVREMSVVVRSPLPPDTVIGPIRQEVSSAAADLPIANVRSMETLVERSRARMQFSMFMFLVATVVALVLSAVGVYGFVSYLVGQRTPEIGIRMAIGADPATVRWMVLKESLAMAAAGVVLGLVGALALTRGLGALLFGVRAYDPLTFAAVPVLLLAVVLLASYPPAARAARLDPVIALQAGR